ncbi:glycosyltransferase family 2 protein [bacterium]|nr:glycosyltransferase family 2 protein [bacterium]
MISVIIVNYNGLKWLKGCLDSLKVQTYKDFEIIFVDNASTDGSVAYVKKNYPKVKVLVNKENYGFAKGNNIGYKASSGEYIVLLNNDTYVEKDYLKNFIKVFKEYPKCGIAQSKIVLMDDPSKLDSAGSFWTGTAFLYHEGYQQGAEVQKYNNPYKVFSVKGASMLIKKEVIEKVGLFDEDFWCYYEETDFCHRAWMNGYESWYYPTALCYHKGGSTSSQFNNEVIQYHNIKNKLSSFYKNFSTWNFLKYFLLLNFYSLLISFYFLLKLNKSYLASYLRSLKWFINNLKILNIKKNKISSTNLKKGFVDIPRFRAPIKYYFYLLTGLDRYPY